METQTQIGVTEKRREEKIGEEKSVNPAGAETPTKSSRKNFVKPSLEEVAAYCKERGNSVDPQRWVDFYESKGWKIGREAMKDWKASVRTWEKNSRESLPPPTYASAPIPRKVAKVDWARAGEPSQ